MTRLIAFSTTALFLLGLAASSARSSDDALPPGLLDGDWQATYDYLAADSALEEDPIAGLLALNACRAINRNNEVDELMRMHSSDGDRNAWYLWTDSLRRQYDENPVVLYLYGDALVRFDHLDSAWNIFTKVVELDSTFALAYGYRGYIYYRKQMWDSAAAQCTRALNIRPNLADLYHNRGLAYWQLILMNAAIADFNRALELNPNFTRDMMDRGQAYLQVHQFKRAIASYDTALQRNPGYASGYNTRAVAHFEQGDYDKAWEDLHTAESLGWIPHPGFVKKLREASGREK